MSPTSLPPGFDRDHPAPISPASDVRRVCVFCGASPDPDPVYAAAAVELGEGLARAGIGLVYGGGLDGLMGLVAEAALDAGGEVTGIMPGFMAERMPLLRREHRFEVVRTMHARKQAMCDAADAFVALPGGIGTLEELAEQLTWLKLGLHRKPVVIADIAGFWTPLLRLFDHMEAERLLKTATHAAYIVSDTIDEVLAALGVAKPLGDRASTTPRALLADIYDDNRREGGYEVFEAGVANRSAAAAA